MSDEGRFPETTRGLDSVRELRLMTLLKDLVAEHDRKGAAEMLGVDRKTLAGSLNSGRLTERMYFVLDRMLREGDGRVIARIDSRIDSLEKRMEAIEGRLDSAQEDVRTAMREELKGLSESVQTLRDEVLKLSQPETAQTGRDASATGGDLGQPTTYYHDQLDPSVISAEPRPNEEMIYGRGFPLVVEWRELVARRRAGYADRLEAARVGERILELEVSLMRDLGMTLPPETYPLRGSALTRQLGWRVDPLVEARSLRARRELLRRLRRVLTLGRWR